MSVHDYWYSVPFVKGDFVWRMGSSSLDVAMWMLNDLGGDCIELMASEDDHTVLAYIFARDDGVCYVGDATILKWIDPCWHYIDYVLSAIGRDGELIELYRDGKWVAGDQLFHACFGDDGDPLFAGDY